MGTGLRLEEELNPAQRQAVEQVTGPLLVLAGAGSGKTRVLTYRIAHLIEAAGVAPWQILAVTFTNKAAGEMLQRVEALVGSEAAQRIWIGTFHSICARLLRYEAKAFGLHPDFTIYDEDDRRALLRRVLATLGLSEKETPVRQVAAQISGAKNAMVDVETFARQATGNPRLLQVAGVYAAYEEGLKANRAFDFDDLIAEPVRQLQRCPEVLHKYRQRFRHVLIDEYQDTNRPQYLLARLLAEEHRNLCVVGDDDQSIYQFRGADVRNILDFEEDYPEAVVVRLEQNYRSTGRILAAANAVIGHNRHRKGKRLWTAGAHGDPLELALCGDDRAEARHVIAAVRELCRTEGLGLGSAAVLYRANAQSRSLEEELMRLAVPYTVVGGIRFYERKEIKDLLAYLRLLVNPADDLSVLRVINAPKRGIGQATVDRLARHARGRGASLLDAVQQADEVEGLGGREARAVLDFARLVADLAEADRGGGLTLPELAEEVLERSGYLGALEEEDSPESEARIENLRELLNGMVGFLARRGAEVEGLGLSEYLQETALLTPEDEAAAGSQGSLTLMTLHSAKGLEFPVVAICGLEEEVFPTQRAVEAAHLDPAAMEEERRLLYVGITRAQRHLLLSCARWRYLYGHAQEMLPSRFLAEVPADLLAKVEVSAEVDWGSPPGAARRARHPRHGAAPLRSRRPTPEAAPRAAPTGVHYVPDDDPGAWVADGAGLAEGDGAGGDPLAVGRWVLHPTWGRGQIVAREGAGGDTKLSVRFGGVTKRVLAAYASLQPA